MEINLIANNIELIGGVAVRCSDFFGLSLFGVGVGIGIGIGFYHTKCYVHQQYDPRIPSCILPFDPVSDSDTRPR